MVESVSEQGGYSVQGRTPEAVEFVYYVHHGVGKHVSGEGSNRWLVCFTRVRHRQTLSRPHRSDFVLTYAGSVARTDRTGHPTDLAQPSHRPGQGVCFESTGATGVRIHDSFPIQLPTSNFPYFQRVSYKGCKFLQVIWRP